MEDRDIRASNPCSSNISSDPWQEFKWKDERLVSDKRTMERTIGVMPIDLLFAKSSAELREGQRGRSRRAARSFANGNTKRWIELEKTKAVKQKTDMPRAGGDLLLLTAPL